MLEHENTWTQDELWRIPDRGCSSGCRHGNRPFSSRRQKAEQPAFFSILWALSAEPTAASYLLGGVSHPLLALLPISAAPQVNNQALEKEDTPCILNQSGDVEVFICKHQKSFWGLKMEQTILFLTFKHCLLIFNRSFFHNLFLLLLYNISTCKNQCHQLILA